MEFNTDLGLSFIMNNKEEKFTTKNFLEFFYKGYFDAPEVQTIVNNGGAVEYQIQKNDIILSGSRYSQFFEIYYEVDQLEFTFDILNLHNELNQQSYQKLEKFFIENKLIN